MKPRIKICCISSAEEAAMAIAQGASAVGLVGKMPSGPGPIADDLIKEIVLTVPPPVATFLLTSEISADAIVTHHHRTGTNTIQMVDALTDRAYHQIKAALPAVKTVQVIHVLDEASITEALEISELVDALLLDSGNPKAVIKELGGTGRVHNWSLSRRIIEAVKVPVFLAGGLTANNVQEALEKVNPFGLDVCSGVRTEGKLDPYKLEAFFKAAWS